jgi:hypothetical protein
MKHGTAIGQTVQQLCDQSKYQLLFARETRCTKGHDSYYLHSILADKTAYDIANGWMVELLL